VLFVILGWQQGYAQELDSIPVPKQDQFLLQSKALGEDRTIWVYTPQEYKGSTDSFPVLYLLDGGKHFPYVRELMEYLSDFEQPYIPHMIVVGIPNVDRGRDFTPSEGADTFLAFIRNELVPYIDGHYRTQPYRILEGHSLGGLFTVYANTYAPELFQASILISPALDSTSADTRQLVAGFGKGLTAGNSGNKRRFFVTLGDEGTSGVKLLETALTKIPGRWSYQHYPVDNHFSVPYKSMYDGLRWLYKGWFMNVFLNKARIDWPQIEQHFAGLSKEYGYRVLPSEDFINSCGYEQLNNGHLQEAISIFQADIRLHPNSWNAYDSMGEAYLKAGNKAEAIRYYEQSIKLNPGNEGGKQALEKLRGR
jgi:predicted alpha/beta superfamily hydrolase